MNTEQDLLECQKCGTPATSSLNHCSNCGYGFSSGKEGEGPISFAFPCVENAYKPSGKGTLKAFLMMFATGLPVAVFGGALLYPVHAIMGTIGSRLPFLLVALVYVVLYFIVAIAIGHLIGLAVGKGGLIGKNRNQRASLAIGILCGLVGYGVFVANYFNNLGPKAFNSWIDFIKLTVNFILILGMAGKTSRKTTEENPFCERCEKYMKKISLGKYPIRHERVLMGYLNSLRFEDILDLASESGKDSKDFTEVTTWHCNSCKEIGFIYAESTQIRYEYDTGGNKTNKSETRRIFSSHIMKSDIATLLGHANTAI